MRIDDTQYDYPDVPVQELGQVPGRTNTPVYAWSSGEFDEMIVLQYDPDVAREQEGDQDVVLNADEAMRLIEILAVWLTRSVDQKKQRPKPLSVDALLGIDSQKEWLRLYVDRFYDGIPSPPKA